MFLKVNRTVFVEEDDGLLVQHSDEEIAILRGKSPLGVQIAIFEAIAKEDVKACAIRKAEVTVEELYCEGSQTSAPMVKQISFASLEDGDDRHVMYSLSQ